MRLAETPNRQESSYMGKTEHHMRYALNLSMLSDQAPAGVFGSNNLLLDINVNNIEDEISTYSILS